MNIMTKRGSQDNIVTYEHFCDIKQDLNNIPQDQITLGSVAIVLEDENDSMGIYIANSNKEWIPFSTNGSGSDMDDILAKFVDIDLTNPSDGDTLIYDGTNEKWIEDTGENDSDVKIKWYTFVSPETEFTFSNIYSSVVSNKITLNVSNTMPEYTGITLEKTRLVGVNSPFVKIIFDDKELLLPSVQRTSGYNSSGLTNTIRFNNSYREYIYDTVEARTIEVIIEAYDNGDNMWFTVQFGETLNDSNLTPWFTSGTTRSGITVLIGALDA